MKLFSISFALACLLAGPLAAEVVIEYNSEKKSWPEGLENLPVDAVEQGVCIMAGGDVLMKDAHHDGLFGMLFMHPVRYAVSGDKARSVTIKALPADHMEASTVITVAMGKEGSTTFALKVPEPGMPMMPPHERVEMNHELDNMDDFKRLIKTSMAESEKVGEVPRVLIAVSSTTSFGAMVDMLKHIQAAGCHHGLVIMDDNMTAINDIKIDPEIKPPIAKNADLQENKEGRIVVNVRNDGTFTDEELTPLKSEEAITVYVRHKREQIEKLGINPRLHLRGDKEALFKHGRVAVKAAAAAGVNQVLFATFIREADKEKPAPKPPQPRPKPEERKVKPAAPWDNDLKLALPKPADEDPEIEPLVILIRDDGSIMCNGQLMDQDPKVRELPLLSEALKFYKQGVDAAGEVPSVRILANENAQHQRVIDVLNALAEVGIKSVAFTNMAEEVK